MTIGELNLRIHVQKNGITICHTAHFVEYIKEFKIIVLIKLNFTFKKLWGIFNLTNYMYQN